MKMSPILRLLNHICIQSTSGCWEWQASCFKTGYGKFYAFGHTVRAHKFLFEQINGTVPVGYELDHLCRNRKCVNPKHLDIVTRSENVKRGLSPNQIRLYHTSKTHCPKGHPYDEVNTYHSPSSGRNCRLCQLRRNQEYKARQEVET